MRLADHFPSAGGFLFRWRSYLPLALVPCFVASFMGLRYPFGSHALDLGWEIACFLVSMAGLGVRVFTIGTAAPGTSGRNTRGQKAMSLNTTGPYSVVRHPLYLGNYLIALGLSCFTWTWFLPAIVTLAALLYYERIAAREEQYLEERFGDAFRRWASAVPALMPALGRYQAPALAFSWRRALSREFYAVGELAVAFFVMDVAEDFTVTGRLAVDPLWATVLVLGVTFFTVMWMRKKRRRASLPPLARVV